MKISKKYELGYKKYGEGYQRKYPNEELCRFIGRRFSGYNKLQKKKIKVLEVGCGPGGNLWMLAYEKFDVYGLDISTTSIKLAKKNLFEKKLKAKLFVSDMINLNFKNSFFDVIIDVFSSCHLNQKDGTLFISQVSKKLKKNGIFFSYFPSKKSKFFTSNFKKKFSDENTISKIFNKNQVYGNDVLPMRFMSKNEYKSLLKKNSLKVIYNEYIHKTYKQGKDIFIFNIIEAIK
jgi:SAM-dependent methyltransferase|tara:strand:- start:4364 stop:5062 length:699 start_codon:yes stop_codon:yes gene_type:complete